MKIKNLFYTLLLSACFAGSTVAQTSVEVPAVNEEAHSFIVANDLGRNGYYEQKPIAELMGELAGNIDIEFVAALGDVASFRGCGFGR